MVLVTVCEVFLLDSFSDGFATAFPVNKKTTKTTTRTTQTTTRTTKQNCLVSFFSPGIYDEAVGSAQIGLHTSWKILDFFTPSRQRGSRKDKDFLVENTPVDSLDYILLIPVHCRKTNTSPNYF